MRVAAFGKHAMDLADHTFRIAHVLQHRITLMR